MSVFRMLYPFIDGAASVNNAAAAPMTDSGTLRHPHSSEHSQLRHHFQIGTDAEQAVLPVEFIESDFKCLELHGLPIKGMGYDILNCSANIGGNVVVSFNGDLYSSGAGI